MQHFCNERSDWLNVKDSRHMNLRYTVVNKMTSWKTRYDVLKMTLKCTFLELH